MERGRPRALVGLVALVALVASASAAGSPQGWKLVKRGQSAAAGELSLVGSIVRNPGGIAFRTVTPTPATITLNVVISCRKGIKVRVGRQRLSGRAPYTKAVHVPLAGADNCAVSATGINPAGTLRIDLLRSA